MRTRCGLISAAAALLLMAGLAGPAAAQKADVRYDPISKTVNLDADNADVRQVVRQLLNAASVSRYQMAPGIDSRVTLSLRNTPFDRALQTVLARVGAECDYDNGQLRIYRVGERPGRDSERWDGRTSLGYIPKAFRQHVGLNANNQTLATVYGTLNRQTGVRFINTPQVPGDIKITAVAGDEPLWNVLQRIAQAARLKVDITGERECVFSPLTSVRAIERNGPVAASSCRNCKYELKSEWRYCPMCGTRVER